MKIILFVLLISFINLTKNVRYTFPMNYNGDERHPSCALPVRSQGMTRGSCWAFAATGAMSNRMCRESNGYIKTELSVQELVDCDIYDEGCTSPTPVWRSGWSRRAFDWITLKGIVSESCYTYKFTSKPCPFYYEDNEVCPGSNPVTLKRYKLLGYNYFSTIQEFQQDIYEKGSCTASFRVYEDFARDYRSGVYRWNGTKPDKYYLHAVEVVGRGLDVTGYEYWICKNSYGSGWRDLGGYFWIRKGTNECGIEDYMVCPNVPPSCFGKQSGQTGVCSSRGMCISSNKCSCNVGYSGTECQTTHYCYGIRSIDSNVCSSHGYCYSPDTCTCVNGYSGYKCQTLNYCYGKLHSDPFVCSGNGKCTLTDYCLCDSGYTGTECHIASISCYNIDSMSKNVCSGHGTYTSKDTCKCEKGYEGNACNIVINDNKQEINAKGNADAVYYNFMIIIFILYGIFQ